MKNTTLLLFLIVFAFNASAQESDTIWINKNWKETVRDSASYYRVSKFDTASQRYFVKDYYLSGKLQMSGRYISLSPKVMDGIFTWYYPDKKIEHRYSENNLYKIIEWDSNGKITRDEGANTLVNTVKYINGEPIYEKKTIEKSPEFPEGEIGLAKYISDHLKYPEKARRKDVEGKVIIQFVVDKQGTVSNVSIFKSIDPLLDTEAVRVVDEMPNWIPGRQDGRSVNVMMHMPITFELN